MKQPQKELSSVSLTKSLRVQVTAIFLYKDSHKIGKLNMSLVISSTLYPEYVGKQQ